MGEALCQSSSLFELNVTSKNFLYFFSFDITFLCTLYANNTDGFLYLCNYNFFFLILVVSAKLSSTSVLFKPSPYVELSVDGHAPVKTDYNKNTLCPKWEQQIPMYVF